ncbi:hypothetical protein ERJ75_001303500 [Trypanosoma vivax]|nr:hypothetical protein ERJ75_001303500 [Trypanosoma vivax]
MKRFWTSLLGFASLLALLSANKAQGHAAKGVKRSSAQGACSFATALDAVASAAELAATEAAERSANASAWQEALATALSKTNNATAVDALGTAAALQSMNAQVGRSRCAWLERQQRGQSTYAAPSSPSQHSRVEGVAANCAFQRRR